MSILQTIQEQSITRKIPKMRVGHTVKVHQKIKEGNKERIQIFEGLIIKVNSGHGADKTVTVRKMTGGIGVEKIFPIYSPIFTFEVIKEAKVRRSKLYYMRDRSGKSARLRETFVNKVEMETVPGAKAETESKEVEEPKEAVEISEKEIKEEKVETTEAPKAEVKEEKTEEKTESKKEEVKDSKDDKKEEKVEKKTEEK